MSTGDGPLRNRLGAGMQAAAPAARVQPVRRRDDRAGPPALWSALPLLSAGLCAGPCFLYAAVRLRSRAMGALAGFYAALTGTSLYLMDATNGYGTWESNVGAAMLVLTASAASAHAFAIRKKVFPESSAPSTPEEAAKRRIALRDEARRIVRTDAVLARELRIGRPDLPRTFDDGGLVDVNHVPKDVLVGMGGIRADVADQMITVRERIGGFDSQDDMEVTLGLEPRSLDDVADHLIFVK